MKQHPVAAEKIAAAANNIGADSARWERTFHEMWDAAQRAASDEPT